MIDNIEIFLIVLAFFVGDVLAAITYRQSRNRAVRPIVKAFFFHFFMVASVIFGIAAYNSTDTTIGAIYALASLSFFASGLIHAYGLFFRRK